MADRLAHKNPNCPVRLTEFAPHSDDQKQSQSLLSRLLGKTDKTSRQSEYDQNKIDCYVDNDIVDNDVNRPDDANLDSDNRSDSSSVVLGDDVQPASKGMPPPARTLSSVLHRLSKIIAGSGQTPQAYKDSDFKQYWMPDENCKECYECSGRFHAFRRRHHCRICGQIFCANCCSQEVSGKTMGFTGYLRCCNYCSKVVYQYTENPEASREEPASANDDQDPTMMDFEPSESPYNVQNGSNWRSGSTAYLPRRGSNAQRLSSIFDEDLKRSKSNPDLVCSPLESLQEERKALLQDSAQLRELWLLMRDGVLMQSTRHRLRTYDNCMVGSQIVDWLLENDKATSREQAVVLGQALIDAKWIESIDVHMKCFRDTTISLYRPSELALKENPTEITSAVQASVAESDEENEPLWVKKIQRYDKDDEIMGLASELNKVPSNIVIPDADDLNVSSKSVFYLDPGPLNKVPPFASTPILPSDRNNSDPAEMCHSGACSETGLLSQAINGGSCSDGEGSSSQKLEEENTFEEIRKLHSNHLTQLTHQMLGKSDLSLKWAETILSIALKVTSTIKPNVQKDDDMDLRQYIRIKKIPGSKLSSTSIISGVVCTKNIVHKKMRQNITNPRILLLGISIEYQRVENKLSSLEPQILQEHEFLKNSIGRIATLQPDIVLVEKSVSRVAQGFLLDAGITLVLNVKPSVMQRVARLTQATIVTSIDGLVSKMNLGFCHSFYLHTYTLDDGTLKTLMYFDGCDSHLGCTVTLRGGSRAELSLVKKILNFIIYAAHHSRLELCFLHDEQAALSSSGKVVNPSAFKMSRNDSEQCHLGTDFLFPSAAFKNEVDSNARDSNSVERIVQSIDSLAIEDVCDFAVQDEYVFENELVDNDAIEVKFSFDSNASEPCIPDDEKQCTKESVKRLDGGEPVEYLDSGKSVECLDVGEPVHIPEEKRTTINTSGFYKDFDADDVVVGSSNSHPVEKSLSKKNSERVSGGSDHSSTTGVSKDSSVFVTEGSLVEDNQRRRLFKAALERLILSVSPCVTFNIPYLESFTGSKCKLRSYFASEMYWSKEFNTESPHVDVAMALDDKENTASCSSRIDWLPPHAFVTEKLSSCANDLNVQALLADFRAIGGRILRKNRFSKENSPLKNANDVEDSVLDNSQSPSLPDCLDPTNHQRISVLFSSFSYESTNAPNPCVSPWVVTMNYYGRTDVTLGGFLDKYCFSETYSCVDKSCKVPMLDHIRRFVHGPGFIQVVMKKVDCPSTANVESTSIRMWSWCKKCKKQTPNSSMSAETYSMSFAKFLELRFYASSYVHRFLDSCRHHSLHHDFFQFFGYKQIVVSFKYFPIVSKDILLPPLIIQISPLQFLVQQMEDDGSLLKFRAESVFSAVLEQLYRLKKEASLSESHSTYVSNIVQDMENEKSSITQKIEYVLSLVDDMKRTQQREGFSVHNNNVGVQISDAFVDIQHQVAEFVASWNDRIRDIELLLKKSEKTRPQLAPSSSNISLQSKSGKDYVLISSINSQTDLVSEYKGMKEEEVDQRTNLSSHGSFSSNADHYASGSQALNASGNQPLNPSLLLDRLVPDIAIINSSDVVDFNELLNDKSDMTLSTHSESSSKSASMDETDLLMSKTRSRAPSDTRRNKPGGQNLEPEKKVNVKQIFSFLNNTGNSSIPNPFPPDEHHLLPACQKVSIVVYDQEPSSIIAYALSSREYHHQLQELKSQLASEELSNKKQSKTGKSASQNMDMNADPSGKKGAILSFLKVTSRERSPARLGKFEVDTVKYTPNCDRDGLDEDSNSEEVVNSQILTESQKSLASKVPRPRPVNYHIELQFSDSTANFYCKVCFAEQFARLRRVVFAEGEDRFLRSLSRCFTWFARGGKSGSSFCKTLDNRFILKQMSLREVQSFNEFAPHYFKYVTKSSMDSRPMALAKILGVFKIVYQNSKTTATLKQDLLVMENLFYDRKISQIFDLKGSVRNRLISTTGKTGEGEVLLDENLLRAMVDSPLYLHQHSKVVLMSAITRDTEFLASHLIMDYSLLIGVDESKELVIGIIDYIRTFTWDKKVEMLVKTSISDKMPTVVSPEVYRRRFLEAMDKYFLFVPDKWNGLGKRLQDC